MATTESTGHIHSGPELYRISAVHYDEDYAALGYLADVPFYVDLAVRFSGPVLEMGCGTGRVLIPT